MEPEETDDGTAPTYARTREGEPLGCRDCAAGVQCVACRLAGRSAPLVPRYAGRLGELRTAYVRRRA